MYNVIAMLAFIFLALLNAFECDVTHIKSFFFKIKALKYSQPKGARPAHDPPKYCHAPPVGPATQVWNHGAKAVCLIYYKILLMLRFS